MKKIIFIIGFCLIGVLISTSVSAITWSEIWDFFVFWQTETQSDIDLPPPDLGEVGSIATYWKTVDSLIPRTATSVDIGAEDKRVREGYFAALNTASSTITGITGSTQCLQVDSTGLISGTGVTCGTGASDNDWISGTDLIYSSTTATYLGIGTVNPTAKFHISELGNINAEMIFEQGNQTAPFGNGSAIFNMKSKKGNARIMIFSYGEAQSNWIESGNYAFTGNVPLYITGYNGNDGSILSLDFATVGIDQRNPDRKLDVLDNTNPQLRLTHTDGSVYTDLQTTASGHLYINPSGGNVGIGTTTPEYALTVEGDVDIATSTLFVDSINKRVGIGTDSPTVDLDILGGLAPRIRITGSGNNSVAGINFRPTTNAGATVDSSITSSWISNGMIFKLPRDVGTQGFHFHSNAGVSLMYIDSVSGIGINTTGPDRKLDILDATNPQLRLTHTDGTVYTDFQTTASGHLYINSSGGNVGIGTDSPSEALEVYGSGSDIYVKIISTDNDAGIDLFRTGDARDDWRIVNEGGDLEFRKSDDDFVSDVDNMVTFFNDGSVGIGTTTPEYTLTVDGTLSVNGATKLNGVQYTWPTADGTNTYVLSTNGAGTLSWVAQSGGAGGGTGAWTTTTDDEAIYPKDVNDVVIIGSNTTTSEGYILEVIGNSLFDGIVVTASSSIGTLFVDNLYATSTELYATKFGTNSEYFTDLTGTGLQNSSGVLTLNATGDWTGTLDNYDATSLNGWTEIAGQTAITPTTTLGVILNASSSISSLFVDAFSCTDCINATEIEDIYLLDDGDVGTGTYDFGGAVFEIPNGVAPVTDSVGELALDTSNGQLVYYATSTRVLSFEKERNLTIASTTLDAIGSVTSTIYLGAGKSYETITDIYCYTDQGETTIRLGDGSNWTEYIRCNSTGVEDDGTIANGNFTKREKRQIEIGSRDTATAMNQVSITITYVLDRE